MYGILPPHLTDRIARSRPKFTQCVGHDAGVRQIRAILGGDPSPGDIEVYDAQGTFTVAGRPVADPALPQAQRLEQWARKTADVLGVDDLPDTIVRYGREYANAFFDGTFLVFGEGDGELFGDFTLALDVFAHEFGHRLVASGPNLVYEGQSGALNESFSDVVGVCVRAAQDPGGEPDWKIGEELFVTPGACLRDMENPGTAYDNQVLGRDPQVGHMKDYVVTHSDHGGVHINSGIPNKAFVVFSEMVPGPCHDIPLKVWRATLDMSGPRTDFSLFARASVVAAGPQYGDAARAAWASVGIE